MNFQSNFLIAETRKKRKPCALCQKKTSIEPIGSLLGEGVAGLINVSHL